MEEIHKADDIDRILGRQPWSLFCCLPYPQEADVDGGMCTVCMNTYSMRYTM